MRAAKVTALPNLAPVIFSSLITAHSSPSIGMLAALLADYSTTFWLVAVLAVLLSGVTKAGFGGGAGVIATPLLALTIPVGQAAALMLPILIVIDILSVYQYRRAVDRVNLRMLLPGAIAGIVLGALFFSSFSDQERLLKFGVGILALAFVLYRLLLNAIVRVLGAARPSPLWASVWGAISGFTSTLAHVGGPTLTIYLLPQQLPRHLFVGTSVWFFFVVNLLKLIPYALLGLLRVENLPVTLLLLPLAFIGVRLGVTLNRAFNERWFHLFIYTLLILTGVQLVLGRNLIAYFF
ncbi:MAG: sulfite exporter TauE/SafE family protein [Trueperaceae bacterium]|nr:MAG: sulfite exporter TauE/SafE family protein [Trueperaceae bacterium]